jgi:predicted metal-dependent enzyme (double-stranded beta helix superfamily)
VTFVLDTPVVRAFVADVEDVLQSAATPAEACEAIKPRFAELLADPAWLPEEFQAGAATSGMGGGIAQWLLYRAEDGSLSLFALAVPTGSETPIHDHLAWGPRRPLPGNAGRRGLRSSDRSAGTHRAAAARGR